MTIRMLIGGPTLGERWKVAQKLTRPFSVIEGDCLSSPEDFVKIYRSKIAKNGDSCNYIITPADLGLYQSEFPKLMKTYREMLDDNDVLLTNNILLCNYLRPEENDELFFVWRNWYIELFSCDEFQKAIRILGLYKAIMYISPEKLISLH